MFRKRNDVDKSDYPISRPANTTESYEEFLHRLETLFDGEDAEVFFDAIEKAPVRWQRKPELMISKAIGCLRADDRSEAKNIFDEIERTHPKFVPLYYYKANFYLQDLYPAHVLRMINKVRLLGVLDDEAESSMSEMENISTNIIKEMADELGVPFAKMEKASWHHEAAQEKLGMGKLQSAEQDAREAIRQIPNWIAPRNNHSYILYFMGRVSDAFTEAQAALAQDSNDFHALKNLVIFHTGIGEDKKAREYSERLSKHLQTFELDDVEMDTIISVLSLMNDHATLWELAQKYAKRDYEDLLDNSWYSLAVASIHIGHMKEAQKLLEKNERFYEPASDLLFDLRKSLKEKKSVSLRPAYSVSGLLLPAVILGDLQEMLSKQDGVGQLPKHIQKKIDEYIQKRPFVINGLFRLLFEPRAGELIPLLLLSFNRPDVDARLLEIALGDTGTIQQRLHILSAMAQEGRDEPASPIRFWNDEIGEWMEVDLFAQMLSDDIELNISPKAALLAEKAHEATGLDEKISLWKQSVEVDPKSGYAVHMLGIMMIQDGQREEGKIFTRRALEVDPDYMFAYANNALIEAQEENPNIELMTEWLNKVTKAQVITSQTAFLMHAVRMMLAFDRKDFDFARKEFEIAVELRPDDPVLNGWDSRLKFGEVFAGGWLADWQEKSRQRARQKVARTKLSEESTAVDTLNILNREILGTTARIWKLASYGKKAELINNIVERMQNAGYVKIIWDDYLNDAERGAFRWILENGGVRPLKDFTDKYGSDEDESPYWNYHKPETIIGRLGQAGFLAKGMVNDEQVVLAPLEVRNSIINLI